MLPIPTKIGSGETFMAFDIHDGASGLIKLEEDKYLLYSS